MIHVTRLDGTPIVLNCDLVQWVEETPDTVVVLTSGERVLVRETSREVAQRALEYKRSIAAGPALRAVPPSDPVEC
jgi:flagellar protein FlbD